jgi:hypothetical protein
VSFILLDNNTLEEVLDQPNISPMLGSLRPYLCECRGTLYSTRANPFAFDVPMGTEKNKKSRDTLPSCKQGLSCNI